MIVNSSGQTTLYSCYFQRSSVMENRKVNSKMYLEIVGELRHLIKDEGIKTGEKLPSERELAERMQVGRSTIREALRSLELLGLIETRRGEGTFLADFKKNQFVEVLAEFILQQPTSMLEVQKTRRFHETAAIQVVCESIILRNLPVWESLLVKIECGEDVLREDVLREMIIATENRLSLKIWFLLKQYSNVPLFKKITADESLLVNELLRDVLAGDSLKALRAYSNWIELVEGERGEERNDS